MDIALRVFRHNKYQELLQASDVDDSDLTDLLCQCVECGNFVVWVAANSKDALKRRSAHFRHLRNVDSKLAIYCEKRVSSYSSTKVKNLQRSISESRHRYIRNEFWKLMSDYYCEALNFQVNEILDAAEPKYREMGELFASSFRKDPGDFTNNINEIIDSAFKEVPIWLLHRYVENKRKIMFNPQIQKYFMKQVAGQLNRKLHYLICSDVLKFIKDYKSSLEICIRLFTLAAMAIIEYWGKNILLGLEAPDGSELFMCKKDEQGNIDFGFYENPKNQVIIYNYAIGYVLAWVTLIPYNQTIKE